MLLQCTKRGLPDYVDLGGASGLDHTKMEVLDSVCGLDSNEGDFGFIHEVKCLYKTNFNYGRYMLTKNKLEWFQLN